MTTTQQTAATVFAAAFNAAFDRLRRDRPFNLVKLSDLRRALPQFDRTQFDAGLKELRKARLFVLETFEGRHGHLSDDERSGAIREDGRLFVYAARVSPY
jgi:hypothetical protein